MDSFKKFMAIQVHLMLFLPPLYVTVDENCVSSITTKAGFLLNQLLREVFSCFSMDSFEKFMARWLIFTSFLTSIKCNNGY